MTKQAKHGQKMGRKLATAIVSFAAGPLVDSQKVSADFWLSYASKIDCSFVAHRGEEGRRGDHKAWNWRKLRYIREMLQEFDRVIWADADSAPTPTSPNIALEEECEGEVLGIQINEPCPHAQSVRGWLMRFTGDDGRELLDDALSRSHLRAEPWPDERAIGFALGWVPRGLRFEREPLYAARYKVSRFPNAWLKYTNDVNPDGGFIHASVEPKRKAAALAAALARVWG